MNGQRNALGTCPLDVLFARQCERESVLVDETGELKRYSESGDDASSSVSLLLAADDSGDSPLVRADRGVEHKEFRFSNTFDKDNIFIIDEI